MAQLNKRTMGKIRKARKIKTVIDTETTGFANRDRLIEFCSISVDGAGREYKYLSQFNPGLPISPYATAVHGYVNADLRGAPKFKEIKPDIQTIINRSDEVIAHNANFDIRMLRNEGINIPENKIVDTMRLARDYKPLLETLPERRYNLDNMCKGLGVDIPRQERHTAFGDARACLESYRIMSGGV
jgi:DNA polymerase III epsilon subunit family exonuclease